MLFTVGKIPAIEVCTQPAIGVPGIHNDHVHVVAHILLDERVHKKRFSRSRSAKYEFRAVRNPTTSHGHIRRVYTYRNALPIGKVN
ncbi:hypothetical protein D3C85_1110370 [compost metagenome]